MALAKIEFVELPCQPEQPPLRLYSTEVDADTAQRKRLARMLLAYSRLAVVMVGDLPPHALATALLPMREAITQGPWLNRELLMLPLASASTLAGQAAQIAKGAASATVRVQTTPLVTRPAEAWAYLRATWGRLRKALAEETVILPDLLDPVARPPAPAVPAEPQRAPLPMQPMPAVRAAEPPPVADPALATYVRRCSELKGMVSVCVYELATQRTLAFAGTRPGPAALASQGASLMASMAEAASALNLGDAAPDAAVTFGNHHLLLRTVPGRRGLALHAVLDKAQANLTLLRLQLQRLDLQLEEAAAPT
jgi:hypothetical protein